MNRSTWPSCGSCRVIYVIENNGYAMGTSVKRSSSTVELYKRGESFGIPGVQVDGMDVIKVREAAIMAADHARWRQGGQLFWR